MHRAQLYASLAVAHVLDEDLERAQACLHSALALLPAGQYLPQLLFLQVYLDLRRGNSDEALACSSEPAAVPSCGRQPLRPLLPPSPRLRPPVTRRQAGQKNIKRKKIKR